MIFPRLIKYLRPWGTIHLPTAFADYTCVLMISRRQWVTLFGPAVPIKVVATVKVRNKKLIHLHFSESPIQLYTRQILSQEKYFQASIEYVKYFARLMKYVF
jgi:hypothetical protein